MTTPNARQNIAQAVVIADQIVFIMKQKALIIPRSALHEQNQLYYVMMVRAGQVE